MAATLGATALTSWVTAYLYTERSRATVLADAGCVGSTGVGLGSSVGPLAERN